MLDKIYDLLLLHVNKYLIEYGGMKNGCSEPRKYIVKQGAKWCKSFRTTKCIFSSHVSNL